MNHKFDELAKTMAQSVTRRGALKKCGVGFVGMALATFGLGTRAEARNRQCCKKFTCDCSTPYAGCLPYYGTRDFNDCLGCCGPRCG